MDSNLKLTLVRIAESVGVHHEALLTLSKDKAALEKRQHEAKIGTIEVLSKLSQLVKQQVKFGKDFAKLCQAWDPLSHPHEDVPAPMGRRLREWHQSFPSSVQRLRTFATSLVESTQSYKTQAKKFASDTQILHRDGMLVVEGEIGKVQEVCVKEAERLTRTRANLLAARDRLLKDKIELERALQQMQVRIDNHKPNNDGLGFSLAGTGLGVASLGLLAACPPVGAAMGLASFASSMLGLGLTGSSIAKSKKLIKDAEELSNRGTRLSLDAQKLEGDSKAFVEQFEAVTHVAAAVQLLVETLNPIISAAEVLERTSVQRYSTSSLIGLQVSGIQSSSAALEMVTTQEHLIDCVEAILSDFSYSNNEHRLPKIDWEISTPNLPPADSKSRAGLNVRLEHIILSRNHILMGTIAVKNIAFAKSVIARYTLDKWKTMSEVVAEYNEGLSCKGQGDGFDRFNFSINLAGQTNLEASAMEICVKYGVNGEVHWDSNGGRNFQVKFKSDDIALYKVLDELVAGLEELKVNDNMIQDLKVIQDREDYQEVLRRRTLLEWCVGS